MKCNKAVNPPPPPLAFTDKERYYNLVFDKGKQQEGEGIEYIPMIRSNKIKRVKKIDSNRSLKSTIKCALSKFSVSVDPECPLGPRWASCGRAIQCIAATVHVAAAAAAAMASRVVFLWPI